MWTRPTRRPPAAAMWWIACPAVNRRCARPGCPRPAEATLSYSYPERLVWVDDLTPDGHPMVHDLCEHHATSLSVPKGWERHDRRAGRYVGSSLLHDDRLSA